MRQGTKPFFIRIPSIYSFQDIGLHYMRDKRHPEDQLFFIAEGDFRFYPEDCVGAVNWLETLDELVREPAAPGEEDMPHPALLGHGAEPVARSDGAEPVARSDGAEPVARSRQPFEQQFDTIPEYLRWSPGVRCKKREGHPTQELNDLVRIVTHASRKGLGNLVWLSWCAQGKRKRHP